VTPVEPDGASFLRSAKGSVMNGQVYKNISRLKKTSLLTGVLFFLSLFSPFLQTFAFESSFYDGPGGFANREMVHRQVNRQMNFHRSLESEATFRTHKLVGMGLGAAVGGGLVAMLGLAASPIIAAATIIGSVLAGGFLASQVGNSSRSKNFRVNSSNNFLSWAGGLAGGLLGFMIPGGSIIGAGLGTVAGGMLGNALADNTKLNAAQRAMGGGQPPGLIESAMHRFSGGFMGPMGAMAEGPMVRSRLLTGMGPEWAGAPGWFQQNGQFTPGMQPGMNPLQDPRMMNMMPMDFRTDYVWHDNNGELAYPGWEEDLYRVDGSGALSRRLPEWTTGRGNYSGSSYDGRSNRGYGPDSSIGYDGRSNRGYGSNSSNRFEDDEYSSGSSIENPDWEGSSRARSRRSLYDDGDQYSSHTTSDGETFNPSHEIGSNESLVNLSSRYQDAVEELRNLTAQDAPALQRKRAHKEVQRLERMLHQVLR